MGNENIIQILNQMSVYVRRAWDHTMPLNWEISKRYIYDFEILFIKEGEVIITIKDKIYEGKAGDVFFFRPLVVHSIKSIGSTKVRQPHIHFDFCFDKDSIDLEVPLSMPASPKNYAREDITKNSLLNIDDKITFKNPYRIDKLITDLVLEHQSLNPLSILRKKSLMFELLYLLFNNSKFEDNKDSESIFAIVKNANIYIQENSDKNITTEDIAEKMGYSKNYFVKLYKDFYGMTPIRYHENNRLEKAKSLIHSTNMTFTEIAYELGFENVYTFSRYFKRLTKMSPKSFRENQ